MKLHREAKVKQLFASLLLMVDKTLADRMVGQYRPIGRPKPTARSANTTHPIISYFASSKRYSVHIVHRIANVKHYAANVKHYVARVKQ